MGNKQVRKEPIVVDIIIPVYSNFEMLDKVLLNLPELCENIKYKVYLVDDLSPDLNEKGKEFYKHLRANLPNLGGILEHKINKGFGQSCNDGANLGSSELVMILSTDVLLGGNSIKIMADHLLGSPEVGVVFPKLMFFPGSKNSNKPAGKIQSCGIVFDITQQSHHIFLGWDADHPFVNLVKDYNGFTGATFIIRRKLWYKLKGFDPNYGRGTYEDVDLAMRVRMEGFKCRYLPQAFGYHGVGISAELTNSPFPLNRNFDYFKSKFNRLVPYDEWMR